ncbi:hypothetical protein Ddc_11856 [Ditylenchus destructor]|nr:hypothetical protein Ddc_11856 [Ditylenchus destructor]
MRFYVLPDGKSKATGGAKRITGKGLIYTSNFPLVNHRGRPGWTWKCFKTGCGGRAHTRRETEMDEDNDNYYEEKLAPRHKHTRNWCKKVNLL